MLKLLARIRNESGGVQGTLESRNTVINLPSLAVGIATGCVMSLVNAVTKLDSAACGSVAGGDFGASFFGLFTVIVSVVPVAYTHITISYTLSPLQLMSTTVREN